MVSNDSTAFNPDVITISLSFAGCNLTWAFLVGNGLMGTRQTRLQVAEEEGNLFLAQNKNLSILLPTFARYPP
jgi:hypothetical protein